MKKTILPFLLFISQVIFAQQNQLWKGYFSYNTIKDVTETPTKFFAAAENAIFSKNIATGELKTTNSIDGLSGQTISNIYHSTATNKTIVGYENGLIMVINNIDGTIINVVDILNKNIPSTIKRINHFMEYNDIIYISCDFGIVQYNITNLEFGDTYFIGNGGTQISVKQTAVFEGNIYAATLYNGIRRAAIDNPNLIDYNQWTTLDGNGWTGIETLENNLFAISNSGYLYKFQAGNFVQNSFLQNPSVDLRKSGNYLIATTANNVFIYNSALTLLRTINRNQVVAIPVTFTCATVINEVVYIGTNENGVVTTPIEITNFEFLMPDGPIRNNIFALATSQSSLWTVYGGYTEEYNPYGFSGDLPVLFGISKLSNNNWLQIPKTDILNAKSLCRITINPSNENEVYVSSFFSGILKIENDVPTILYNTTNSGLESLIDPSNPSYRDIRINGTAFDKQGNLWVTTSLIDNGLKQFKTSGQWQSYNTSDIIDSGVGNFNRMVIDKNNTKWIASQANGVIAYNESSNIFKKITVGVDTGNLPSEDVRAIALDNRNQVWVGTKKGLRIISSTGSYNSDTQIKANPIIILEDGVAQELLYEQFITDIAVNGSNQKWIGTADSGVFLFSPNGQETIYHFTKDNSPLPSNTVNDIDINATTGEVFIATDKGMVSFKGTSTKPADNLESVYVYPNPVRPEFTGTVKIAGLISKANIKITDIEGNLVFETTSEGGTVEWDTTAFSKYKVASGVYMIFIAGEDGVETATKKVMIVR